MRAKSVIKKVQQFAIKFERGHFKLAISLDSLLLHVALNTIILSPFLWLSGRVLVGKEKARFTDAILIVILGTVVGALFGAFFAGFIAAIIQLVLWLLIVKYFFNCGWLKAFAVSILAVIIFVAIVLILGVIGFALFNIF